MCKPKKNLRDCDRLCFVTDNTFARVVEFLLNLPDDVYDAVYYTFSRHLSRFSVSPSYDRCQFADELRYWNVSAFSWFYGKSGIGVHFSFNSFQLLGL